MTKEEALKIYSAFNNGIESFGNGGRFESCDTNEVNKHAILLLEALEKQMIQKPKLVGDTVVCPNCERTIADLYIYCLTLPDYCCRCGQMLNSEAIRKAKERSKSDGNDDKSKNKQE